MYQVVKKENGNYGLRRIGSVETHGDFETMLEAMTAGGLAMRANCLDTEETR